MIKKSNIDFELSESKPKGFFQKTITLRVFILYFLIVIISMVVIIYSVLNQQINAVLLNQENKSLKTRIREIDNQIQSEKNEKSQYKLITDSLKLIIPDLKDQIQHLKKEKTQSELTIASLSNEIYALKDRNSKLANRQHQLEQEIQKYKLNEKIAQKNVYIDSLKSVSARTNKIYGMIINKRDDTPVADAKINFVGLPQITSTDENGNFSIFVENVEQVRLKVTKDGFKSFDLDIALPLTKALEIKLESASIDKVARKPAIKIESLVKNNYISGSVSGLDHTKYEQYKIIVYVKTDFWYIHPYIGSEASIDKKGKWRIETVLRSPTPSKIVAFIVPKDYNPPTQITRTSGIGSIAEVIVDYK